MLILFLLLGAFGGFLSGLLGVGGAVVMIPLMLNVPPLFGFGELSMQCISGLSIVQVFFASISGLLRQRKNKLVHRKALVSIGSSMVAGSLAGVAISGIVSGRILLVAFGCLALVAFAMMLFKPPVHSEGVGTEAPVSLPLSLAIGLSVGVLSGMVGAGGGFILIPLMIYLLRLPTKVTIGTSLGIVFLGSVTAAAGKIVAGQVDWPLALALVAGAVPAAQAGAAASAKLPAAPLRWLLVAVIGLTCVQTWWRIIAG